MVDLRLVSDISGQNVRPIFKGHAVEDFSGTACPLKMGCRLLLLVGTYSHNIAVLRC